ncbi:SRPBCC domain-containing protein [Algoriphagus sp. Y33]|uniref:SRPBCC domain-containing protein n=1 Tax=Algoriphagus sp. Y33 TaxID=2772483 RepID=UPI00177CD408|nr:SRPBCC domain-containing protein [Algoriphagus sp. Y33]
MNNALIVNKEKLTHTTPKEIWEVITATYYFDNWMFVPGKAEENKSFGLGSNIKWINEKNIVYLTGEVISFVPQRKFVISLQDISWKAEVPKGTVTYEYHLIETDKGTKVKFYLGDLSIDPEGQRWFDAYNESDEIGAIEKLIERRKTS